MFSKNSTDPGDRPARVDVTGDRIEAGKGETPYRLFPSVDLPFSGTGRPERVRKPVSELVSQVIQPFHVTQLSRCPYLEGRQERKIWTELPRQEERTYNMLSLAGFRRSHMVAYRPVCPGCQACIPVRVRVEDFVQSRSMRRICRNNSGLQAEEKLARATLEQYELFEPYVRARHSDGDMVGMSYLDYRWMVEDSPDSSRVIEFREESKSGARNLVAAVLLDTLDDGYSAVYSFYRFDDPRRSLGSWVILWMIERAREKNLPFIYLGFWIPRSPKMAYKGRFQPLEGFLDGRWQELDVDLQQSMHRGQNPDENPG